MVLSAKKLFGHQNPGSGSESETNADPQHSLFVPFNLCNSRKGLLAQRTPALVSVKCLANYRILVND
jgi:hypothetical protein